MNQDLMEMINKLDLDELKKLVHLKEQVKKEQEQVEKEWKEKNLNKGLSMLSNGCSCFIKLEEGCNLLLDIDGIEYSIYADKEYQDGDPYLVFYLNGYDKEIKLEA